MRSKTVISVMAALLAFSAAAWADKLSVIYAREIDEADTRLEYPVSVLNLALQKSGADYEIHANSRPLPQGAAFKRLAAGTNITVVWSMTTRAREADLLPIRIPIDKGLFGYRIAFVSGKNRNALANVKTLADLQLLTAGQGHDWPDTEILRANGLNVAVSSSFFNLFPMLNAARFDYFPRSVLELWEEVNTPHAIGSAVDESLLIHYPTAVYFFVNKANRPLADALERGLNRAIADGSFDTLFYARFGPSLKRAKLRNRVSIALNNPLLPPETPLSRKSLWLDINALPR